MIITESLLQPLDFQQGTPMLTLSSKVLGKHLPHLGSRESYPFSSHHLPWDMRTNIVFLFQKKSHKNHVCGIRIKTDKVTKESN